jgi:DNA-binding phage protein
MTYQQLAVAAHVDRATLSDMLNHRRNPTLGSVHAVIHALGLEPAAVLVFT